MRLQKFLPALMAGILIFLGSCQTAEEDGPTGTGKIATRISGSVIRSDDQSPVPLAIVTDVSQAAKRDTTDDNGLFELVYDLDPDQTYTTSLFARRDLFGNDTLAVFLKAGVDTTVTLTLVADSTSPVTSVRSGRPASIVLIGTDVSTISIRGSGVNESALLTYEVRDSLGNAITGEASPDTVKFNIIGGPDGGEYVFPQISRINATTGRVTTRLNSGTRPGVIQVQAATRNDSVVSSPARITIASGPPDGNNVTISREKANIPGLVFDNERSRITVILGDRYQNPVPEGTAVYFTTNMGLVQATGKTDIDGIASAQLISASPRPGGLAGIATVTARTIGDTAVSVADSLIQRSIRVTFSGTSQIQMQTSTIVVSDSGNYLLKYEVQDQYGNPLSEGTTIAVTLDGPASGELSLSGDVDVTLEDTDDTTKTNFSVRVEDNTRGGLSGIFTVKVEVKSRNGDATRSVGGFLTSTGGGGLPSGQSVPRSIVLNNITNRTLSVKGTGANETSRLSFVVTDSLGNPVGNPLDPTQKAYVTFSLNPSGGLGGGESLYPPADSTNDNGVVSVSLTSGTRAGVLQVVASTFVPGVGPISASPVQLTIQGGLPDSNRFFTELSQLNMPGLAKGGPLGTVTVQAADTFGNATQTGTAVYFSTSLGLIEASSVTTDDGTATANLSGGVENPTTGNGVVTVQTIGKNGEAIRKYLPFLFTGATQITGLPANGFFIQDSGSYAFSFTVADQFGNPLSPGTTVEVTSEGPGSGDLELSGDINVTLPDVQSGFTNFNVSASDKSKGGVAGPVSFAIAVSSDNGDLSAKHTGTVLAAGQSAATGGGTTFAQSILLQETSGDPDQILSVSGTGSNETVVLRFIVKDSLGGSVDQAHAANVLFSIEGGPGGGEFVFPSSGTTDASGTITTTLNAGTKAGVLQVRARTTIGATTISSAPVPFTIVGGLPDSNHFTVWTNAQNYAGWIPRGDLLGNVFVQLGDLYGNPVQSGVAVYFTTTGGVISGTAFTDAFGHAQTGFFGGEPFPLGGIDTITISTVDRNNNLQARQIVTTYSGAPIITSVSAPNDSVTIFDGGFFDLDFNLADVNGNPLAQGNTVSMSVTGTAGSGISLSGDAGFTTIDTRSTSFTNFRVRLVDSESNGGVSGPFTLRISVNGPNGTTTKQIYGTLGAPQAITPPSPTVKNPAQIAFVGISATDIFVQGVGALENTVVTYEVRDSLGSAIEANPRAYATFALTFFPNTWVTAGTSPRLIPDADSTDNAGRLRVSISAGTTAGIIQVVATVLVGGNPIISRPVKITIHAGFPDQQHFTIAPERFNFPGLDRYFVRDAITVQIADKYSNPVEQGTAAYFNSAHGTMQTGGSPGLTNADGFINRDLISANPRPEGPDSLSIGAGFSYVYARTLGDAGAQVIDSLEILWTGAPIITRTSGPATFTVANGGSDGPWTFSVVDRLNHPMSSGTAITVTAGGAVVDGDADIALPDTKSNGPGLTSFTILIRDSDPADIDPPIPALLTVTVNHPVYGVYKAVIASGTVD